MAKKVNKPSSQDAYVYALVAGAEVKLRLQNLSDARKDLDAAESILDTFDSVETEVHAAYYRTNASYYQVWPAVNLLRVSCKADADDGLHRQAQTLLSSTALRSSTSPV